MAAVLRAVDLPGGLRLPYAEQGDPAGSPVLFVHAIGDSWRSFELVLAQLPSSVHAFAPALRGHGDASRPATGYDPRDFAADLAAFMDALALTKAVVVGGSSGGFVARWLALDHPERVRGLVLLGAPAQLSDKPVVAELWESTVSTLTDPIDPAFVRGFGGGTLYERVPQGFVEAMVQESLKVPAHVWKQTYLGLLEDDSLGVLRRIAAPTLIVWGNQDPLLDRVDQERLAGAIPGALFMAYEGVGHVVYWEEPARVARDVAAFVARFERPATK